MLEVVAGSVTEPILRLAKKISLCFVEGFCAVVTDTCELLPVGLRLTFVLAVLNNRFCFSSTDGEVSMSSRLYF